MNCGAGAGGQHDGKGFLALLAAQVELRGEPTAERPSAWSAGSTLRPPVVRFGLQIPHFLAPAAC